MAYAQGSEAIGRAVQGKAGVRRGISSVDRDLLAPGTPSVSLRMVFSLAIIGSSEILPGC